jgi:phage terminase large subunit-like protein
VCLDEVHAHKSPDLLNVLKSAAGARRSPLFLFTTTEGYETPGPWPEQRRFAQQVLEQAVEADHFLAVMFMIDDGDDEFDPKVWRKANPLIDANPILATEIAKEAVEAKAMPSRRSEFLIKRCNRQAASASGWVNVAKWRQCDGPVDLEALVDVPCWIGVDLASTSDMTAMRIVWRDGDRWLTCGRRWVPANAVAQRRERGTVQYAGWVAAGLITQTQGESTDYSVIETDIREACARFNVQRVAFDPWNARDLMTRLAVDESIGPKLAEFRQGTRSYHPAMQELERAYTAGRLAHGGDPVLLWCASNLVARQDENGNMAPARMKSADKIDDMAALLMAIGSALVDGEAQARSFWDKE